MFHFTYVCEDMVITATDLADNPTSEEDPSHEKTMFLVTVMDKFRGFVRQDKWTDREFFGILLLAMGLGEDGLFMIPPETFRPLYKVVGPLVSGWGESSPIP